MATSAQIAANRRNGAKSKGPKTKEGLAVASRNSLKHGLTAEQIMLIFGEAEDDFIASMTRCARPARPRTPSRSGWSSTPCSVPGGYAAPIAPRPRG